ncbi:MAG: Rrf2 family transcriptional regulator [Granulosicoccaceae bacterium]|jgi:Rrf2 family nitric oxide-sensitive transcriptional repressor
MQLTRHTDYALRLLMYLAANPHRVISVSEIAGYYKVSRNHLVKVVQGLTEHGYVATTRGKQGGMQLAKSPDNIPIGAVVRHMENHFHIVECLDSNAQPCPIDDTCRLKGLFQQASKDFLARLDDVTLADMVKPKLRRQLVHVS